MLIESNRLLVQDNALFTHLTDGNNNRDAACRTRTLLQPVFELIDSDKIKPQGEVEQRQWIGIQESIRYFSSSPWSHTLGEDILRLAQRLIHHPSFHLLGETLLSSIANSDLAIANRAAHQIALLQGQSGSISEYLQNTVKRLSYASNLIPLAFGMASAGLAARGVRVGIHRIFQDSTRAFLGGERGLHILSASGAFAAQGVTFPIGIGLGQSLVGRDAQWEDFTTHVQEGFLLLGGLNLAGIFSRNAYRLLHGVQDISGVATRAVSMARYSQWALPLGAELGALTLLGSVQNNAGDWSFHFIEGAGTLVQARLGSGFNTLAFPGLHLAYQRLDLASYELAKARIARSAEQLLQRLPNFSLNNSANSPQLAYAAANNLRVSKLVVEPMSIGYRPHGLQTPNIASQQTGVLRRLIPEGKIQKERLSDVAYVKDILQAFGVTQHSMDIELFRNGFEAGKNQQNRIVETAFDVDEVILHWSLGIGDLFRGIFQRNWRKGFSRTPASELNYQSLKLSPQTKLSFAKKILYDWLPKVLPIRMRQNIQFHPGMRALLLGLKMGSEQSLIMATTGPAGRILLLANEDAAFKYVFFDRLPDQTVSIRDVRESKNIYTREDLLLALRRMAKKPELRHNPMVKNYAQLVRENPSKGVKIKHPAIAKLRGKRSFSTLVDDSGTTFKILGGLDGFTILQPPSARPSLSLNFTLGRTAAYLDRMTNGYANNLVRLLGEANKSQAVSFQETPADYPHQRFAIEIPWRKFGEDFIKPAAEMKQLAKNLI